MDEATRLDIDDIALIRAFGSFGNATQRKVDDLLKPLFDLLPDRGLGLGPVAFNKSLFKATARTIGYGSLFGKTGQVPYLCAGVVTERGTDLAVWIETTSRFKLKEALHRALGPALVSLNERAEPRRTRWALLDPSDGLWWDLEIRLPFERLLAEDDQPRAAREFFAAAFEDLKACDIMRIIRSVVNVGATAPPAAIVD